MASGALFGSSGARSQSSNLVEFRAGKMFMRGKMVHPDKRKGLVYVYQSDDSLMHFCWKDRTSGTVEDDLIIFPDDIEYKHVTQCTTGRVYILKFKSSSRKFFFWMQEPKTDKDDEHRRQVNDFLNNPPAPGSNRGSSGGGGLGGGLGGSLPPELAGLAGDGDINSLLSNMNQQQLMQLLSGMGIGGAGGSGGLGGLSSLISGGRPSSAQSTDSTTTPSRTQSSLGGARTNTLNVSESSRPATTTAATPSTTAGSNSGSSSRQQIQLSDLQNILSTMTVPSTPSSEPIDLSKALGHETLIPLLANPEVQERLIPFLPDGETLPKTAEELRATVLSPQFQQAVTIFSSALASGQLGPLISNFGLGDEAASCATAGDVEGFVKAVQEYEAKQKKDKDEKMDDN